MPWCDRPTPASRIANPRHEIAIPESCICVRDYGFALALRSGRRTRRRAASFSLRLSSASSAWMSSAWSVTSSVAARMRACLSNGRGNRTVVCAIGSWSADLVRGGMQPPTCCASTIRSLAVRSAVHRAPSPASASRVRCCDEVVNIAWVLTRGFGRRTIDSPFLHPYVGGSPMGVPFPIGIGVGPWGGRLCSRAATGYRMVPVRIQGGGFDGHCRS